MARRSRSAWAVGSGGALPSPGTWARILGREQHVDLMLQRRAQRAVEVEHLQQVESQVRRELRVLAEHAEILLQHRPGLVDAAAMLQDVRFGDCQGHAPTRRMVVKPKQRGRTL
jgi:hypothetical protein